MLNRAMKKSILGKTFTGIGYVADFILRFSIHYMLFDLQCIWIKLEMANFFQNDEVKLKKIKFRKCNRLITAFQLKFY